MKLHAVLTRTHELKPLAVLCGGPFNGVELTPAQLRNLASAFNRIAEVSEQRPCTGRKWMAAGLHLSIDGMAA